MADKPKITAVIITFNEEQKIERCLKSLDWVDEIIVVDSFSKDRTVEICRRYTERVYQHPWPHSSSEQRKIADRYAEWQRLWTMGLGSAAIAAKLGRPKADVARRITHMRTTYGWFMPRTRATAPQPTSPAPIFGRPSRSVSASRVGEGVAPLAPHRSGRADFPHPALRSMASLRGVPGCEAWQGERQPLEHRLERQRVEVVDRSPSGCTKRRAVCSIDRMRWCSRRAVPSACAT